MSPLDRLAMGLEVPLGLALLGGLLVRGHWQVCLSFCGYLLALVSTTGLLVAQPSRFFNWDYWVLSESLQTLLKFCVVVEIATRVFQNLPRARTKLMRTLLLGLTALVPAIAYAFSAEDSSTVGVVIMPRVLYATALMFAALLVACLWYHVPLHPIHKAILLGWVPYLLLFTVTTKMIESFGWDIRELAGRLNILAFYALLLHWLRAAWRPFSVADASPTVVSVLQPWAARRA